MIGEAREVALLQKQHRIPCNPNGDERKLIARLMGNMPEWVFASRVATNS